MLRKSLIFLKGSYRRLRDVWRGRKYDIIFVQREAFMTGSMIFERLFAMSKAKLVFDFDDAIWRHDVSHANRKLGWLKDAGKTGKIIAMSDLVIAGNRYLADFASNFNKNVIVIPTTIDTSVYIPEYSISVKEKIVIGWSGSMTTIRHFELAVPFLKALRNKYGDKLEFRVIGDENYSNDELGIKGLPWRREDEIVQLRKFDIGIMPIPDDEWSRGKCGLKGLQYMALEIATVMSPVGVNTEIIRDGINGFLADKEEEWVHKLSVLIEDEKLRRSLGMEARKTVEAEYSVNSQQFAYLSAFNNLLKEKN